MGEVTGEELTGGAISVPDHVVFRAFDAETVLLNLRTGQYHGLNATGGRVLELLKETGSVSETAAGIAAEFGRPVEHVTRDVVRLCGELAARGLILVATPPAA